MAGDDSGATETPPAPDRDPPDLLREPDQPRPLWLRGLCLAGALVCLVLGVVGWLVPVITGIPFYLAGLVLLAIASDGARSAINRLERGLPRRTRWGLRRALRSIPSERLRRLVNVATPEEPDRGPE